MPINNLNIKVSSKQFIKLLLATYFYISSLIFITLTEHIIEP